jgi:hypothetical protein
MGGFRVVTGAFKNGALAPEVRPGLVRRIAG